MAVEVEDETENDTEFIRDEEEKHLEAVQTYIMHESQSLHVSY